MQKFSHFHLKLKPDFLSLLIIKGLNDLRFKLFPIFIAIR